jgi:beta-glucosidase
LRAGERFSAAARALVAVAAAGFLLAAAPAPNVEQRVEDLLARMTLEEKIGQLNLVSAGPEYRPEMVTSGRVGAVINFNDAPDVVAVQRLARQSRLKIPLLVSLDILHGFRTSFPVPLAAAATFDPDLVRRAAAVQARETAAIGVQWTFAPMVDVSRDARWGRIVEGTGEDPYLGSAMAAAQVEGFRAGGLATSPKHFAGYGAAEGGRDYDAALIPRGELRDVFLPPFRAAIRAGSNTIMAALTALNGVPAGVNRWLLTDVLRGEWGFDGFVVSDWAGLQELIGHGVAADPAEAARKAILAGVDMDMMSGFFDAHLAEEVRAGRVPLATIDTAVRRVLRVKFRLGLFDRPDPDPEHALRSVLTPEIRALAREAARASFVLVQNRGDLLPLGKPRSIAVVGGLATSRWDPLGPHAARGHSNETVSFFDGIKQRAERGGTAVTFTEGCDPLCAGSEGFPAAVDAARQADVVIAVMGEPRDMSGEAASRAHLDLPGKQAELVDALIATGKPVVLVLIGGRPITLGALAERVPAILMTWYPGTEGGHAVADVLFGDASPTGKLPVTWLRAAGQAPLYYNRLPSGRPHLPNNRFTLSYLDEEIRPLYPFGFGLGYTRFAYSDLAVRNPKAAPQDTIAVEVTLTNAGARDGVEVAQLYVRKPVAERSRPVRELKGFRKIALAPGESRRVIVDLPARSLGYHLDDGTYVVEAGVYEVGIGGDSTVALDGRFEITGELRLPPGHKPALAD